ncbi:cobyrinate a,c-diamide synthase [Lichenifustis flavocetrariae]|uniref:Hydrogenobyrinate a,c-diamide synthase n=1 Tax=Lichenifustis flavocetrariae TaxID=2949735 RepID=A0AA42CKJ3_9HYPH|nr:cobyrinate a,c-diamide synthase [Lichenifustis flavocetrariae]MCW6510638.1 cobyrinate a,c-diamide synthase [Lichenifustis flavocetrariae]
MTMPRGLVIAGPRSGSGKTTVTLGLLRALSRAGVKVAGAKCGPDYIDPAFHARACGRPSFNLDSWAMEPEMVRRLAARNGAGCDLVLCEGLMGLFDGVPAPQGRSGSTADIAAALGWPVVLVHDVSGQAQSAAAQIAGCAAFDPRIKLAGVILNRVGSDRHRRLVASALDRVGLPLLAALPKAPQLALPERHLGLVQAEETADLDQRLDAMADFAGQHIAMGPLVDLARDGIGFEASPAALMRPPGQRIALARDEAFSFIYPHLLDGWRQQGAEILPFSPLRDEAPPEAADACWLPGGYPELHGHRLAAASHFLGGLRAFAETRPVHGECGGYMVLGKSLTDAEGTMHAMAGLLSVTTSFAKRKLHLGYRDAELLGPTCLGPAGTRLRGHEFHYASVTDSGDDPPFALVRTAYDEPAAPVGSWRGHVTGTFFHLIAASQHLA